MDISQDNKDNQTLDIARLGIEAESFMSSSIGKYLLSKADELIDSQTNKLIQCSPTDVECNTESRNGIQIGALFKQWLDDAVIEGRNAQDYIQQVENESLS